ncbi:putative SP-containing protein [Vairimorpha necatrix]|uniref:SP-containing protein n=1 Tax=Vairimorpha necatrix TaxID=6039 RepID=A0AAX4JFY9_9MICR
MNMLFLLNIIRGELEITDKCEAGRVTRSTVNIPVPEPIIRLRQEELALQTTENNGLTIQNNENTLQNDHTGDTVDPNNQTGESSGSANFTEESFVNFLASGQTGRNTGLDFLLGENSGIDGHVEITTGDNTRAVIRIVEDGLNGLSYQLIQETNETSN